MITQDMLDALRRAAIIVDQQLKHLNQTRVVCELEVQHWVSWTEGQSALELEAAARKLRRLADTLQHEMEKPQQVTP